MLIQGPSGCGKTTLLRCIALLESIDKGTIEFEGQIILRSKQKPRPTRLVRLSISMVFQQLYLWNHMTVLENIALPLRLLKDLPESAIVEKAMGALDWLNIADKALDYPINLSGGQQQRVALARALVHSPKLLLLDEITANVDKATSVTVLKAVERIRESGTSTILVSHSPNIPDSLRETRITYEFGKWHEQNRII